MESSRHNTAVSNASEMVLMWGWGGWGYTFNLYVMVKVFLSDMESVCLFYMVDLSAL